MSRRSATQTKTTPSFTLVQTGLLQRKCESCGQHTIAGGECAECGKKKSGLQRKLAIDASNDPLELEADRVANQVMRRPETDVQRQREPEGAKEKGKRKAIANQDTSEVPSIVHDVLRSPGQPLDDNTRAFMEPRFEQDFSQVRVHTDAKSGESARAVNAIAYTVGKHMVFNTGQYSLSSTTGRLLVAHELTHTLQQPDGITTVGQISHTSDSSEREANSLAEAVVRGESLPTVPVAMPTATIQRQGIPSILDSSPSVEVPALSEQTVREAKENLRLGRWQEAVDVIVDEMVKSKQIDRSLLLGGRVHFLSSVSGEGVTTPRDFRRDASGSLTAIPIPIRLGRKAFTRGISWLYSSIVHEYQHVLQLQQTSGLATVSSVAHGQQSDAALIAQQDVEAYTTEILQARMTGEDKHSSHIKEIWNRLHSKWVYLGGADKVLVKDLYVKAHTEAEAILGAGTLPNFRPLLP